MTEFHGIDGQCVTIGHAAKNLSLNILEWAAILERCANALAHIHGKGFVHCDIKDNNIILQNSVSL